MFQAVRNNVRHASHYGLFPSVRHCVGADILLARHGGAIASMRLDRGHGRVVAVLSDGTLDSAPNLIDPALDMSGRMNEDTKLIAAVCAATVGLTAVMTAAVGLVFSLASPEQLARLVDAMGSYTAAM